MATYQQVDWTGEEPLRNCSSGVTCGNCSKPIKRDLLQVGRKSDYCSDACKMQAYRKRQKALRNVQREKLTESYQCCFTFWEQDDDGQFVSFKGYCLINRMLSFRFCEMFSSVHYPKYQFVIQVKLLGNDDVFDFDVSNTKTIFLKRRLKGINFEELTMQVSEVDAVRIFSVKKGVFQDESDYVGEDEKTVVFGEAQLYKKTTSVGSDCNTHTKQWKPTVNDKNKAA